MVTMQSESHRHTWKLWCNISRSGTHPHNSIKQHIMVIQFPDIQRVYVYYCNGNKAEWKPLAHMKAMMQYLPGQACTNTHTSIKQHIMVFMMSYQCTFRLFTDYRIVPNFWRSWFSWFSRIGLRPGKLTLQKLMYRRIRVCIRSILGPWN